VEKWGRPGQAGDDNIAYVLCMLDSKGYRHTHTQNISYIFLFHINSGFANVLQFYIYPYLAYLFFFL